MARRKKVQLSFIISQRVRRATFNKRNKGLMKKAQELSTLCGVEACAIIYNPFDLQHLVWPSPEGFRLVVSKFQDLSEVDQKRKMVNQEEFIRHRIVKTFEQLNKQEKNNYDRDMKRVMFHCLGGEESLEGLNSVSLNDLRWVIDRYLNEIYQRIELMMSASSSQGQGSNVAAAAAIADQPWRRMEKKPLFADVQVQNMEFGGHGRMLQLGNKNRPSAFRPYKRV